MAELSTKGKIITLLLVNAIVASPLVGVINSSEIRTSASEVSTASGDNITETQDVPNPEKTREERRKENIDKGYILKIVDNGGSYYIDNDLVAHIAKDSSVRVSFEDCDWLRIESINIVNLSDSSNFKRTIKAYDDKVIDLQESGDYEVTFSSFSDVNETVPLSDLLDFGTVDYDAKGIVISSVKIGGTEVTGGMWYNNFDGDNSITFIVDSDKALKSEEVYINSQKVGFTKRENRYTVDSDVVKSLLTDKADGNLINFIFSNKNGSVNDYKTSIFVDSSTNVRISNIKYSGAVYNSESKLYMKKSTLMSFNVLDSKSRVSSVGLYNGDSLVSTYSSRTSEGVTVNYLLAEEGKYSLKVEYESGVILSYDLFGGDSVVFDDDAPLLDSRKYTVGGNSSKKSYFDEDDLKDGWYNADGTLRFIVYDGVDISDKVSVTVNGKSYPDSRVLREFLEEKDGKKYYAFSLDSGYFNKDGNEQGTYNITIVTEDMVGNKSSYSAMVKLDSAPPTYIDDKGNKTLAFDSKGITYISTKHSLVLDDKVLIKEGSKFLDNVSGIDSVVYFVDSKALGNNTPNRSYDAVIKDGVFQIPSSLSNSSSIVEDGNIVVDNTGIFVVTDKAGNSKNYTVRDLVISVYDLDPGTVIVDNDSPTIIDNGSTEAVYTDSTSLGKVNYYSAAPVFRFAVKDSNLRDARFYINNALWSSKDLMGMTSADLSYDLNNYGGSDGKYTVKLEVTDILGKLSTVEYNIVIDKTAPSSISVVMPNPVNEKGGNVYFGSSFDVSVSASDNGSGIAGYYLNSKESTSGSFSISSDGEYSVTVKDKVGNTISKTLQELKSWQGNKIVIDSEAPEIKGERLDESVFDDWYRDDVSYTFNLSDNIGLDSATVYINGVAVEKFSTTETNVKTTALTASTSADNVRPNADGSYTVEVVAYDNAGQVSRWSDTVYIDRVTPIIDTFIISGDVKNLSGDYKYVFTGMGLVQINVSDSGVSSGIDKVYVKLNDTWIDYPVNGDNAVFVNIPSDYKGTISAYVVDKVGNISPTVVSDGMVSEDGNTHIKHSAIEIKFDTANHVDANNIPLYSKDVDATVFVKCDWSGISSLDWGVDTMTLGHTTDFSSASKWDKNLPLEFNTSAVLNSNANEQEFWVRVVDNAGHKSEATRLFSIDKETPTLRVSYNETNDRGIYYNTPRTANITVTEKNFDSSRFVVTGEAGTLGNWSNNGDVWSNIMYFDRDGKYNFSMSVSDRAGNVSNTHTSGEFIVDKTAPELSVTWNVNNGENNRYYDKKRVATIKVVEDNFDSSLINITGVDSSTWSHDGNVHTMVLEFLNGEYSFSINGKDLAGNEIANTYNSGSFIVDTVSPDINVSGISNNVTYKDDVGVRVEVSDSYIDYSSTYVTLKGKSNKEVKIEGTVVTGGIVYTYNNFPKEESYDDVYTLFIHAKDRSGNYSQREVEFTVNRFGSSYKEETSTSGVYHNTPRNIQITESNVENLDTSKVTVVVTRNGREVEVPADKVTIKKEEKDGRNYYTYEIDKDQFEEDGSYTVQIYSETEGGDENSSVSEEYGFVVDTTPPEIFISGIEDNGVYSDTSKRVSFDIRDLSGIEIVEIYLNGVKVDFVEDSGLYYITVPESSEPQNLEIKVIDKAGNESTAKVTNFTVSAGNWKEYQSKKWVEALVGGLAGVAAIMVGILFARKRKRTKEELNLIKENEQYYSSSSKNSSGSGSGGSSESGTESSTNMGMTGTIGDADTSATTNMMNAKEATTGIFMSDDASFKADYGKQESASIDDTRTSMFSEDDVKTELMGTTELESDGSDDNKTGIL